VTSRFDLGVASFDPRTDRVLLWTRLHGGDLHWIVARDPDLDRVVRLGPAHATGEPWTVTVDVDGLEPGTTHWYAFETAGERSPVGRTRTLPSVGDQGRLRIGLTCCARYSQSTFAVYGALAGADVDLVVHLGDYVYEDAKEGERGREPDPPHDAVTAADYLARHAQHRRDPDLQALHAAHPMVVAPTSTPRAPAAPAAEPRAVPRTSGTSPPQGRGSAPGTGLCPRFAGHGGVVSATAVHVGNARWSTPRCSTMRPRRRNRSRHGRIRSGPPARAA